ncbi:hypothetical protein GE061_016623 [Apolygus lucorum]|uniref:Uncharacterized protein n=1 Tax=Apolygus lucorum TaxID=248454 RepID=A0A6A4JVZ0_APOLU|nr:hypothetical protein GE061_016623 [Apolygus lucorum]
MHRTTWLAPLIFVFIAFFAFVASNGRNGEEQKKHITEPAKVPKNNLSCYVCDTTVDGERCSNLNFGNKTTLLKKCQQEDRICMVKRFSYTTSTENSTSILRMWSLQRSCTSKCEPGCIVIGERTKLYACTACCNVTQCNTGKGAAASSFPSALASLLMPLIAILCRSDFSLTSR